MENGVSSGQLALDLGAPGRAPVIDILYFALLPDREVARRAMTIAERDFADQAASGFLYMPDRLHLSVDRRWEGSGLPDLAVDDALRRGARVDLPPVAIELDRLESNGNGTDRPRVLTTRAASPGFSALVRQVTGFDRPLMAVPHMTLYRAVRAAPAISLPDPITFTARELVLIHARRGTGTWSILKRWPLAAPVQVD